MEGDILILDETAIKSITKGAFKVNKDSEGFHFHRFTEVEEALYNSKESQLLLNSPAGVKLMFITNSTQLKLVGSVKRASPVRSFYAIDIKIDDILFDCIKNFDDSVADTVYSEDEYHFGSFEKVICMKPGNKKVEIYLPYGVSFVLKELHLEDDSVIMPIKSDKILYAYGDSITHGFDALHPSESYISKISDTFGIELFNKGIGGMVFDPCMAEVKNDISPDYIMVAYGTNDFGSKTREEFAQNCKDFLTNLSVNYPKADIFVIAPLRRLDKSKNDIFGDFIGLGEIIQREASKTDNVKYINAYDYIPARKEFFGDGYLHPNDKGFELFYKALYKELCKYIEI